MSVKTTYENLIVQKNEIRGKIEYFQNKLEEVRIEYQKLLEKKAELSKRTSELAKSLLAKVPEQIEQMDEDMAIYRKKIEVLQECLITIEESMEKCPKDYIQEQSTHMIQEFLDYVSENEVELGSNLQTIFCICIGEKKMHSPYGEYVAPTGNIKIKNGENIVTISTDFYMEKELYTVELSNGYDSNYVLYTSWFINYVAEFMQALQEKLMNAFKEHPNFKIDFSSFKENDQFTLELK